MGAQLGDLACVRPTLDNDAGRGQRCSANQAEDDHTAKSSRKTSSEEKKWQEYLEAVGKRYANEANWDGLSVNGGSANESSVNEHQSDEKADTTADGDGVERAEYRRIVDRCFAEFSVTPEVECALLKDVVASGGALPVSSCRLSVRIAERFAQLRLDQVESNSRRSLPLFHINVQLPCTCIELVAEPLLGRFAGQSLKFVCTRHVLTVSGCRAVEMLHFPSLRSTISNLQELVEYVLLFVHPSESDRASNPVYDFGDDDDGNGNTESKMVDSESADSVVMSLHFQCMRTVARNLYVLRTPNCKQVTLPSGYRQQLCGKVIPLLIQVWPSRIWTHDDALTVHVRPHTMVCELLCMIRKQLALPSSVGIQLFHSSAPVCEDDQVLPQFSSLNCVVTGSRISEGDGFQVWPPSKSLCSHKHGARLVLEKCRVVVCQVGSGLHELQIRPNATLSELESHVRCVIGEEEVATSRVVMLLQGKWTTETHFLNGRFLLKQIAVHLANWEEVGHELLAPFPSQDVIPYSLRWTLRTEGDDVARTCDEGDFPRRSASLAPYQLCQGSIIQVYVLSGPAIPVVFHVNCSRQLDMSHHYNLDLDRPYLRARWITARPRACDIFWLAANRNWTMSTFLKYVRWCLRTHFSRQPDLFDGTCTLLCGNTGHSASEKDRGFAGLLLGSLLDYWRPFRWKDGSSALNNDFRKTRDLKSLAGRYRDLLHFSFDRKQKSSQ